MSRSNVVTMEQPGAGRYLIVFGELDDYDEFLARKASSFLKFTQLFDLDKVKSNKKPTSLEEFFLADKVPKAVLMLGYYADKQAFADAVNEDNDLLFNLSDGDMENHYFVFGIGNELLSVDFIGKDDEDRIFGFSSTEEDFFTWHNAHLYRYPKDWHRSEGRIRQATGAITTLGHGTLAQLDMRMFSFVHLQGLMKKFSEEEKTAMSWYNTDLLGYRRNLPLTTPFTVFRSNLPGNKNGFGTLSGIKTERVVLSEIKA